MSSERPLPKQLDAAPFRFAIVSSRFNEDVTDALVAGARSTLFEKGATDASIEEVSVPGAFEIALVAKRLAESGRFDVIITLGAVIKGETSHFELISNEAAAGINRAALDTGVPIVFGVLATATAEQALARAGGLLGNRGADAALVAIELAVTHRDLAGSR